MNNEIIEILQLIGNSCYCGVISEDKCEKYCNYITNLQEENKSLKTHIKTIKRRRKKQTSKKNKYKDRIDKALKYIEEHKRNVYDTFGEGIVFGEMEGIKEIIKILKGEENDKNK